MPFDVVRYVVVSFQVAGLHYWPDIPLTKDGDEGISPLDKVSFLRHHHRHVFYITCKKQVAHNDRDIEIIMLKRKIQSHLEFQYHSNEMGGDLNFNRMSCEDIAEYLINKFDLDYCKVLEDNENGAELFKTLSK